MSKNEKGENLIPGGSPIEGGRGLENDGQRSREFRDDASRARPKRGEHLGRSKEKRANLTPGGSLIEVKRGLEDEGQRLRAELGMVIEEERRTVAPWAGDVANFWICALLGAPTWVRDWAATEGRKVWEEHLASPKPVEFRPIPAPCDRTVSAGSVGPVVEARPVSSHGTGGEPGVIAPKDGRRKAKPVRNH